MPNPNQRKTTVTRNARLNLHILPPSPASLSLSSPCLFRLMFRLPPYHRVSFVG